MNKCECVSEEFCIDDSGHVKLSEVRGGEALFYFLGWVYLLCDFVLFLFGWVEPYLACFLAAWLGYSAWDLFRRLHPFNVSFSVKRVCGFGMILLLSFGLAEWSGITALFDQHILDFQQRNAVYGNLCSKDWPLILPDGRFVSYYMAQFLPPAYLSKIFGMDYAPTFLMLWTAGGLFLGFSLLWYHCRRIGSYIVALLIVLFVGDPVAFLKPLSELMGTLIGVQLHMNSSYFSLFSQVTTTINHTPPVFLAAVMMLSKGADLRTAPLLNVLLLPISIFGAMGMLPFSLYRILGSGKSGVSLRQSLLILRKLAGTHETYLALLLTFVCALYYMSSESTIAVTFAFFVTFGKPVFYIFVKTFLHIGLYLLMIGVPFFLIRRKCRGLILTTLIAVVLVSFFYICGGGPNELCFKGALPSSVAIACLWQKAFQDSRFGSIYVSAVIAAFVVLNFINFRDRVADFGYKREHIRDAFNGHLYHPGTLLDQSVGPRREPVLRNVLYDIAGASRRCVLFRFLPSDDSKLYERPFIHSPKNESMLKKPDNAGLHIIWHF